MKLINQFSLKSIVLFLGSFGFFLGACITVVAASEENAGFHEINFKHDFFTPLPITSNLTGYQEFLVKKVQGASFAYIRPDELRKMINPAPEPVADSTDNIDKVTTESEVIADLADNMDEVTTRSESVANPTDNIDKTPAKSTSEPVADSTDNIDTGVTTNDYCNGIAISAEEQLRWIKNNIFLYFTEEEIQEMTLVIQAEDEISQSNTEWAAHAWVILTRLHHPGFAGSDTIHGVLTAPGQFTTYGHAMGMTPNPDIGRVVIDVMARYILEQVGFTGEDVGRVVPETHLYWNGNSSGTHNLFYASSSHRGDPYEPIKDAADITPYDT